MKTYIKNLFLVPILVAGIGLMLSGQLTAQTFTNLHSFTAPNNNFINSDGAKPKAQLILSGNTLYGTAYNGGSLAAGTVFAINTDGMGFTNLYSFSGDGEGPDAGLILSGDTLYGTVYDEGSAVYGAVFAVHTNGTGFTNLYSFTHELDGATPIAGLILSGDTLYGTASQGGSSAKGTVFAVNTNGTGFTNLHSFTDLFYGTNSDGANPNARLILSGNTLYGTAADGGSSSYGTVFAVNTDGTGFTNLYNFTDGSDDDAPTPISGLILSGNTLYGTTAAGGSLGAGKVFAVNTDGTGFTNLHSFAGGSSDGAYPDAGLILSGSTLYGTTVRGGISGEGTMFAMNINGTGFTNLYSFTAISGSYPYTNSDGANPMAGLILSGNTLYGTASAGGSSGAGSVFSLALPMGCPAITLRAVLPDGNLGISYDSQMDADTVYVANNGNTIEQFTDGIGSFFANIGGWCLVFDNAGNLYVGTPGNTGHIEKFSSTGTDLGVFANVAASGLAFDSDGSLYATDPVANTITKITPGVVDSIFASTGMSYPEGPAFDSAGNLYVANGNGNWIEKFSSTGTDLGVFAYVGASTLAFDSTGNLYASPDAGVGGNQIVKITPGGGVSVFADPGTIPYGLAFDSAGNLYATCSGANTIEKFSSTGTDLGVFAHTGLSNPMGIALQRHSTVVSTLAGTNYTFTVTSGALPNGLSLASNGSLTGLPLALSTNAFTVTATDANGCTGSTNYTLAIKRSGPVETSKPVVAIKYPASNTRTNLANITVSGTAKDIGVGVALVLYRLNGGTWQLANTASGFANWTADIGLTPGTNIFAVKSVDYQGNESTTISRSCFLVAPSTLTLLAVGTGGIGSISSTPNGMFGTPTNGATLELGRSYTETAVPGINSLFTNWTASVDGGPTNVVSSAAKYTFQMQTNLTLSANFVTNSFIAAAGSYYGLFFDKATPLVSHERAGLFTLKTMSNQKFSGKLYVDGNTVGYAGLLDLSGHGVSKAVIRKGKSALQVTVQMTFDGSDGVSGSVVCFSNTPYVSYGAFTSALTGFKAVNMTNNPATNLVGDYTLAIDVPADPLSPKGNGYGTITVKPDGSAVLAGNLGDYAKFAPVVVPMSKDGDWPLYATTYKGDFNYVDPKTLLSKTNREYKGSIIGWMKFTNNPPRELLNSSVHWIKTANTNNFYEAGFTNHDLVVFASAYNAPTNAKSVRALNISNGNMVFVDGDLPLTPSFSNHFFMKTNSQIIINTTPFNVNTQSMAIAVTTGGIKGKFYHPNDPLTPVRVPIGVVLQDENIARGVFKGTNSTGSFILKSD